MPPIPSPDEILAALDPEQRAAAVALDGPVVILAGAGTGKTRAITHRIAYAAHAGIHDPRRVLAVTFTARAAGEMRQRLAGLGVPQVSARTFHAAALRQLNYFYPRAIGGEVPRIMDSKAPIVAAAASRVRVATDPTAIRDLSAEIEWAKVSGVSPETYARLAAAAGRLSDDRGPAGTSGPQIAKVYEAYEQLKTDRGVLDFEDVLLSTVGVLEARHDLADEVRSQYRYFTVDEYQDVNPLQQRLLNVWLGERDALCVVGDPSQTIYTFAGADPTYLTGFRARYRSATEVRLVRSYRSTPQVVELANRVLASARGAARSQGVRLVSQRDSGVEPTITAYDDELAEAAGVARSIKLLIAGGTPVREIAVLYRVNAQSANVEEALNDAGIPYVIKGGARFFERAEVRQGITLLRGAARGDATELPLGEQVSDVLAAMNWSSTAPVAGAAGRDRWEALAALVSLATDLESRSSGAGLADLVADLDARATMSHAPVADGVTLASLHAAKGLEWDAVFLIGLASGLFPHREATLPAEIEEERRLFYVGLTRAREHLQLTWARARTPGQRASRSRSFFLDDALGAEVGSATAGSVRRGAGGRKSSEAGRRRDPVPCRVCGRSLVTGVEAALGRCRTCPATYDEGLYDRLKEWRRGEATRIGKPAFVVFSDATLQAIAETLPSDEISLARISGLGPVKRDRWGACLLAMVRGEPVPDAIDPEPVESDA